MDIITISFFLSVTSIIISLFVLIVSGRRTRKINRLCEGLAKFTNTVTENLTLQSKLTKDSDEALLRLIKELYGKVNLLSIAVATNTMAEMTGDAQETASGMFVEPEDDDEIMKLGDLMPPL